MKSAMVLTTMAAFHYFFIPMLSLDPIFISILIQFIIPVRKHLSELKSDFSQEPRFKVGHRTSRNGKVYVNHSRINH